MTISGEKRQRMKAAATMVAAEAAMLRNKVLKIVTKDLLESPTYSLCAAIAGLDGGAVAVTKGKVAAVACGAVISVVATQLSPQSEKDMSKVLTPDMLLFAALYSYANCLELKDAAPKEPLALANELFMSLRGYTARTIVDDCQCEECQARRAAEQPASPAKH